MLYQTDTELLFPSRVIPSLADLRGPLWKSLVDHILTLAPDHPDVLGFVLLMVRLNGCLTCTADSYRAMRGCTQCAGNTTHRHKSTDEALLAEWQTARQDILNWVEFGTFPETE